MHAPVSHAALKAVADAIFSERPSTVVEAYSEFSRTLRTFESTEELSAYATAQRDLTAGSIHVAIHYPDMAGKITISRVALDPEKCNGHAYRYKVEGWGLIWVHLRLRPGNVESFISANSEKRANAWASTLPELESPSTWDWRSVARHLRRLRRALKLAA
jgi:hypothetical protein